MWRVIELKVHAVKIHRVEYITQRITGAAVQITLYMSADDFRILYEKLRLIRQSHSLYVVHLICNQKVLS